MILLAKISNSLEMQFEIEFNEKLRKNSKFADRYTPLDLAIFLCEIGLSSRVVLWLVFVV